MLRIRLKRAVTGGILTSDQTYKFLSRDHLPVASQSFPRALLSLAYAAISAIIASMATLTIRQLDEKTKARLRVRAAHHGRSMEEEAREILRSALTAFSPTPVNLAETIQRRFARFGGVELPVVKRDSVRDIPAFEE